WPQAAEPGATSPVLEAARLSADRAILGRRSARGFADAPLDPAQLGALAVAALARTSADARAALSLAAVVHRVRGVASGHYAWDAAASRWRLVRGADLRDDLVRTCLGQSLAGEAAVALVVLGDVDAVQARWGARGARDAYVEAGRIAHRIYLAAGALGLGARNLAAFVDDSLSRLLGLRGDPRVALHLTLVGAPSR
ncbi:MAG: hypothetical protein DCC71_04930, partial [Proteobacteria bacterium]